jgi:hypothetical protein
MVCNERWPICGSSYTLGFRVRTNWEHCLLIPVMSKENSCSTKCNPDLGDLFGSFGCKDQKPIANYLIALQNLLKSSDTNMTNHEAFADANRCQTAGLLFVIRELNDKVSKKIVGTLTHAN